jgi:hypothetical protein
MTHGARPREGSSAGAVPQLALPDRHRPEYGEKAAMRSRSVDGSMLAERWKGAVGWAREAYWGFDSKHLPLQGRVWYPEGQCETRDGRYGRGSFR